jgi:hypothetical protein
LSRTPASAGNRKTWTWSGWVKRSGFGSNQYLFNGASNSSNQTNIQFYPSSSETLNIFSNLSGATVLNLVTTQVLRDPSAWYHIVVSIDTTQATSSNRAKLYINGSQVTSFSTETYPSQNADLNINDSVSHSIGAYITPSVFFNGYLTEINFIDGQALTPSSFGETDAITGRWKAKTFSGTYGTNGFYLKFADNSGITATTLGKDSSPNGNNWTPNNFSVTAGTGNDSLVDSPSNYGTDTGVGGNVRGNYCTLSAIDFAAGSSGFTLTDGNLRYSKSADSGNSRIRGTMFVGSGKYYWEYNIGSVEAAGLVVGIASAQYKIGTVNDTPYRGYNATGNKVSGATATSYGSSYTANDVIGLAADIDAGTLIFYKNGSSQGTAFTDIAGSQWTAFIQGEGVVNCNFGQRPFAYAAPSGLKALCTQNLTQPTIQKPSKYMDALAYTGTGASNAISSLGFSPDLVWIKNRGTTTDHALYDIVRGAQAQLSSNTTGSEVTSSSGLTAFDSAGFTIGTSSLVNTSGTQYVAWSWDAGSANSTNTSGSITSTIRTNPQAGFSIVSYTGNGTAGATIGHGLGSSPKMMVVKSRSRAGDNWDVYHASIGATGRLYLNLTNATDTSIAPWSNTAPTSSVFSVGTAGDTNANTVTYIAYCFSEIEGYSKFGSYTGNGSADGPFVWCGFRPRWVMVKMSSSTGDWYIFDTARDSFNATKLGLLPNSSQADGTYTGWGDVTSNGFKIRRTDAAWNTSGGTYIFAAFAESPFKYARAR